MSSVANVSSPQTQVSKVDNPNNPPRLTPTDPLKKKAGGIIITENVIRGIYSKNVSSKPIYLPNSDLMPSQQEEIKQTTLQEIQHSAIFRVDSEATNLYVELAKLYSMPDKAKLEDSEFSGDIARLINYGLAMKDKVIDDLTQVLAHSASAPKPKSSPGTDANADVGQFSGGSNTVKGIAYAMVKIFQTIAEIMQTSANQQEEFLKMVSLLNSHLADITAQIEKLNAELEQTRHQQELQKIKKSSFFGLLTYIGLAIAISATGFGAISLFMGAMFLTQAIGFGTRLANPESTLQKNSIENSLAKNGLFAVFDLIEPGLAAKAQLVFNVATLVVGQGASSMALALNSATGTMTKVMAGMVLADQIFRTGSMVHSMVKPDSKWSIFGSMGSIALLFHEVMTLTGANKSTEGKIAEMVIAMLLGVSTGLAAGYVAKNAGGHSSLQAFFPKVRIITNYLNIFTEATGMATKEINVESTLIAYQNAKFLATSNLTQTNMKYIQELYQMFLDVMQKQIEDTSKFEQALIELNKRFQMIFTNTFSPR